MDRVHQWMGNLFYRRVSIDIIKEMDFQELKYWNEWHEILDRAYKEQLDNA